MAFTFSLPLCQYLFDCMSCFHLKTNPTEISLFLPASQMRRPCARYYIFLPTFALWLFVFLCLFICVIRFPCTETGCCHGDHCKSGFQINLLHVLLSLFLLNCKLFFISYSYRFSVPRLFACMVKNITFLMYLFHSMFNCGFKCTKIINTNRYYCWYLLFFNTKEAETRHAHFRLIEIEMDLSVLFYSQQNHAIREPTAFGY